MPALYKVNDEGEPVALTAVRGIVPIPGERKGPAPFIEGPWNEPLSPVQQEDVGPDLGVNFNALGCVRMHDGRVAFNPKVGRGVMVWNPADDSVQTYSQVTATVAMYGCILHPNGKVYFVPNSYGANSKMMIFDPVTNTASFGPQLDTDSSGTGYYGVVLLKTGELVFINGVASKNLRVYNVNTGVVTAKTAPMALNWGGCLLPDGRVFLPMNNYVCCAIWNPIDNSTTNTANIPSGFSSRSSCCLMATGEVIIGSTSSGQKCLIYNPEQNTFRDSGIEGGNYSFINLPNGYVMVDSYQSTGIKILNPVTGKFVQYPGMGSGSIGLTLLDDGSVIRSPYIYNKIRRITGPWMDFDVGTLLSEYLNKPL